MRRRIQLYLGGSRADLPDDALVLFNWAVTDATNPAVVKNSFSQSFDLPRTARNEAIFGHSGRLDRIAGTGGTGADFNASRKLPFTIYTDTSEVLAAGYAKLDRVTDDALSVSLYGGLGEFIYNLSFDTAGNKRTLASLDFGGGDAELDFDITAAAVSDAWARLGGDTSKPAMWDIINFAPAYNGIPSDFKAEKALIDTDLLGIVPPVTIDGHICTATRGGGYALLTLPEASDEWGAHDLRSYLQRPVLSVRALLDAIADPANNGGWSVDLSDLAGVTALDSWLTRPLLPSLGTYKSTPVSGASAALNPIGWSATNPFGQFTVTGVPLGAEIEVAMSFTFGLMCPGATAATMLPWYEIPGGIVNQVLFAQALAYDSDGNKVAASNVKSFYCSYQSVSPSDIAEAVGYTPDSLNTDFNSPSGASGYTLDSASRYFRDRAIELSVKGVNIARVDIVIRPYVVTIPSGGGIVPGPAGGVLYDGGTAYQPTLAAVPTGTAGVTGATADTLRSGAHITKAMLLSTGGTPADYLLALCKSLGLLLLTDAAERKVTILRRESFYIDETIDLTERVDRSRGIEVSPISFDAKWYDWRHESVGGRFEKQYADTEGVQYGIQRVDTGYDFDAETKDLLNGSALKSCAAVRDRGRWWFYAYDSDAARMWVGPVMTPGATFSLWDADGGNHDADAPAPTDAATAIPYNNDAPGCDVGIRAEFRDAEDKAVDGADVLLFHTGSASPDDFNLTDDTPAMDTLVGGPCWLVETNNVGLTIPEFSRYRISGGAVTESLDFGAPRELDIPGVEYPDGVTIWARGWQAYIRDRLSVHGKVLHCRVLLDGLNPGPELLRRFFWYRGSIWVLNKISNYSLTTFDPAECEFIQVRDKDAYTNNQY